MLNAAFNSLPDCPSGQKSDRLLGLVELPPFIRLIGKTIACSVLKALSHAWNMLQQKTEVCDSSAAENLEETYGYDFDPQNSLKPRAEEEPSLGVNYRCVLNKKVVNPKVESQNECDSLEEKARNESDLNGGRTEHKYSTLELIDALSVCGSPADFATVIVGCDSEMIEDSIAMQDTAPLRQRLRGWYEQLPPEDATQRTLGELFLATLRSGTSALRELLAGMTQVEAWTAFNDAAKLIPEEIERLSEIAPDWLDWMPV